jgi:hypothetical protein
MLLAFIRRTAACLTAPHKWGDFRSRDFALRKSQFGKTPPVWPVFAKIESKQESLMRHGWRDAAAHT